jgi:exonuclease VII small subunit
MTVLDRHDPSDPRSSTRDYWADEARSTTALRKCVDAFKALTEAPEKLAEAKDRLRVARPEDKAKALRDYEKALKAFDEAPQKLAEARLHFKAALSTPADQQPGAAA